MSAPKQADQTVDTSPLKTGDCERYRPLVEQYDWDVSVAMALMEAESTYESIPCNPKAANWSDMHYDLNGNLICVGSFGLFQISCHDGQVYDPKQNVAIAYRKYQASLSARGNGWLPWGAYTNGSYLKHL